MKFKLVLLSLMCLFLLNCEANEAILIQNLYYPKPGKEKDVYKLRIKASEIISKLGLPSGKIYKRESVTERPYVMWECKFNSKKDRDRFVLALKKSPEFSLVEIDMRKITSRFQRIVWIEHKS